MRISYHTVKDNLDMSRGFGSAGFNIVTSLQALGHEVPFNDEKAPVQISFNHPNSYEFNKGQYRIGYTPWESTELPNGWKKMMNDCDEVWAPSEWLANVFEMNGINNVHVYEHGVDHSWRPIKREPGQVVKFLHVGEPALRKGGQMAIDAFRATFGDREDVHLTVKAWGQHYLRAWNEEGRISKPKYNNVTIIDDITSKGELQAIYYSHDCLVYPSYGEGFGLIPLQALASGMPVICSNEWAPYKRFLGPLQVDGHWDRSIWSLHPGNVFYPDYELLKDRMRAFVENREALSEHYYGQATQVHQEYDWQYVTAKAFSHIEQKFTNS